MVDYDNRASDCVAFMRKQYPNTLRGRKIDGEPKVTWENVDGDLFTFDTESDAAVDICRDMGVTKAELDAVKG